MTTPISTHIYNILDKNLGRMTFAQKETIRDKINADILRQIESDKTYTFINPSGSEFTMRQFGLP
jgi:hypothetical protein